MTHSPPSTEQWASTLRDRRAAARLERVDLARLARRSYQTIRDIELGRRKPSVDTMRRIDSALAQAADGGGAPTIQMLQDDIADLRAEVDRILRRMPAEGAVA